MKEPYVKLAVAIKDPQKRQRRKSQLKPPARAPKASELGFPSQLAKHCLGLGQARRSSRKELALERLLAQTIENLHRLERIPVDDLRKYAWRMTEFPMLVSLRTTRTVLRDWLGPAGIDLAGDRGPGHRFESHWATDDFSLVAEEFVFRLFGGPPGKVKFDVWKECLRPGLRLAFRDHLSLDPALAKKLESSFKSENDRRSAGVLRERVISRLLDKSKNFFGLKGTR